MVTYKLSYFNDIKTILITLPLSNGSSLETELISWGAGVKSISYRDSSTLHLLTLSYEDIREYMQNPSLAGLTIGPNAGRIKANECLTFSDEKASLNVVLTANDNSNQLHGGFQNLSSKNWELDSIHSDADQCTVIFSATLDDGIEGWPGKRHFTTTYYFSSLGELTIKLSAQSDQATYINLTNHIYWLRDCMNFHVFSDKYILTDEFFLPTKIVPTDNALITDGSFHIKKETILNNGFLLNCNSKKRTSYTHAASLCYSNYLKIDLHTDAPAIVIYTGDYLDEVSKLCDGNFCYPGCAIALEPQEIYPLTNTSLTYPSQNYTRTIQYKFSPI